VRGTGYSTNLRHRLHPKGFGTPRLGLGSGPQFLKPGGSSDKNFHNTAVGRLRREREGESDGLRRAADAASRTPSERKPPL
jgi:hypothetical protein